MAQQRKRTELLQEIEARRASGEQIKDICADLGIAPATYYRWKKKSLQAIAPAIRKDWAELAERWQCFILEMVEEAQTRRVRSDVADAVSRVFGVPPQDRSTTTRDEIRKFIGILSPPIEAFESLSSTARGLLEETFEPNQPNASAASLLYRLEAMLPALKELEQRLTEYAVEIGHSGGGRDQDQRIQILVTALADIFTRYLGVLPTHTTDKERGQPMSWFNTFVEDVFEYFLPELRVPPAALREAMRDAVTLVDWSENAGST